MQISRKLYSSGHFCRAFSFVFFFLAHRQIGDKFTERRWHTTLKPAWNRWVDGEIALVAKICVHGRRTNGESWYGLPSMIQAHKCFCSLVCRIDNNTVQCTMYVIDVVIMMAFGDYVFDGNFARRSHCECIHSALCLLVLPAYAHTAHNILFNANRQHVGKQRRESINISKKRQTMAILFSLLRNILVTPSSPIAKVCVCVCVPTHVFRTVRLRHKTKMLCAHASRPVHRNWQLSTY